MTWENPEQTEFDFEHTEEHIKQQMDPTNDQGPFIDDMGTSITPSVTYSNGTDTTFTIDTTMASMGPGLSYSEPYTTTTDFENYKDPVETRLQKIEERLGILSPKEAVEQKYPHVKELREKYEKELEACMTFEYLDPKSTTK